MVKMATNSRIFKLNFVGDVMLGRLIDQLFPTHVQEPIEAAHIANFVRRNPELKSYSFQSPWGNARPLFLSSDLNLINLETSATTFSGKWPDKVFNYRMHPDNIASLKDAKIDYASCANNHSLDFCEAGLFETVKALKSAGIAFAGAGETREEATRPAVLELPRKAEEPSSTAKSHEIHVYSASDHPHDWGRVPSFHLIDYSHETRSRLKSLLDSTNRPSHALKIFSVHWGPNYSWQPSSNIRSLAHFLVDECGVNIIHGHSSHHVQGVEVYKHALIIYGCGDFVDDYAIDGEYRNDLSAIWRVHVEETEDGKKLHPKMLEVFPTRIKRFQAQILGVEEPDYDWVVGKIGDLSRYYGVGFENERGEDGQMMLHIQ